MQYRILGMVIFASPIARRLRRRRSMLHVRGSRFFSDARLLHLPLAFLRLNCFIMRNGLISNRQFSQSFTAIFENDRLWYLRYSVAFVKHPCSCMEISHTLSYSGACFSQLVGHD